MGRTAPGLVHVSPRAHFLFWEERVAARGPSATPAPGLLEGKPREHARRVAEHVVLVLLPVILF